MSSTLTDILFSEELYQIKAPAVIIMDQPWNAFSEAEREQLQKIADALSKRISPKLKLDSFQIVHQPTFDLSSYTPNSDRIIYFGKPVTGLTYYESIEVNGYRVVLSETLSDLLKNEAARQKLWKALQQLFS